MTPADPHASAAAKNRTPSGVLPRNLVERPIRYATIGGWSR
jgi:hypothetical protein